MKTAPTTPKKKAAPRSPRSGGAPRTTLPEEWAFLEELHTTPTSTRTKKHVSPLSLLKGDQWNVTRSPHQGRSSQAFLLDRDSTTGGENEELFVKKVLIMSPDNANDKAYREHRILVALRGLLERGLCFNFVTVVLSGTSGDDDCMELVMEKSGERLSERRTMTVAQLREMLFQLLYALDVAQRELRFVHYDLHSKNVLVEDLERGTACAIALADGRVFYSQHVLVKIADFALSSIELDGESICNPKHAMRGAFDPGYDVCNFAPYLNEAERFKISDRLEQVEAMRLLAQLKRDMKSSSRNAPGLLLQHVFFSPLLVKPKNAQVILSASPGEETTAELPRARSPRRSAIH